MLFVCLIIVAIVLALIPLYRSSSNNTEIFDYTLSMVATVLFSRILFLYSGQKYDIHELCFKHGSWPIVDTR